MHALRREFYGLNLWGQVVSAQPSERSHIFHWAEEGATFNIEDIS